jgi:hypothetical protein
LRDVEAAAKRAPAVRPFAVGRLRATIDQGRIALIAEIKKARFEPAALARAYGGGATCLSVLTDDPSFQGAMNSDAGGARRAAFPLRKDFAFGRIRWSRRGRWGRLHFDHHGGGNGPRGAERGRHAMGHGRLSKCTIAGMTGPKLKPALIGINNPI